MQVEQLGGSRTGPDKKCPGLGWVWVWMVMEETDWSQ